MKFLSVGFVVLAFAGTPSLAAKEKVCVTVTFVCLDLIVLTRIVSSDIGNNKRPPFEEEEDF